MGQSGRPLSRARERFAVVGRSPAHRYETPLLIHLHLIPHCARSAAEQGAVKVPALRVGAAVCGFGGAVVQAQARCADE